jgi:aromatic-L-amino-acid decarboxylase
MGAPGFCAWVTGAPTVSSTAGALAGMVAGSQRYLLHAFNLLEQVGLRWLAQLLGLPQSWQGVFVSGGSVANLVGLGAARQSAFEREGLDASQYGLPQDRRWRLYASSEVHHVVLRAAGVLGLGRRSVVSIPVEEDHRIDLHRLRATLQADASDGIVPVALVASAGTVNTGAVDPLDDMANLAEEFGAWLHVDGAYGLFGLLDPRVAPLYEGLARADSVAVDPHKWMAAPIGCGAAYVRDADLLGRAFTTEPADYLEGSTSAIVWKSSYDSLNVPYHHYGVEHSAPPRGVLVWSVLKEIGAQGMRDRIIRHNSFARHLAARVETDERLELLMAPVLSICCFRYTAPSLSGDRLDELNTEIVSRLWSEGIHIPSTTKVRGALAIRPCYINPRTTLAQVDGLADRVREIGDELLGH